MTDKPDISDDAAAAHAGGAALSGHPVLNASVLSGFHVLEADAGTGKTWTIARLVLRALLESGLTIDQIVVVTFTKAAAAELKARIATLLDAWSDGRAQDGDPFSEHYQTDLDDTSIANIVRQARLQLDDAPISTIHGFCQRVLTEQAMSLGHWGEIDAGADDEAILTEAVADWWRREIVAGPVERGLLIGRNGLSLSRLSELLGKALSCPDALIVTDGGDWATLIERLTAQVALVTQLLDEQEPALAAWVGNPAHLNQTKTNAAHLERNLTDLHAWLDGFPDTIDEDRGGLTWLDPRRLALKKGVADRRDSFSVLAAIAGLNDLRIERARLVARIGAEIREEVRLNIEQRKHLSQQISFDDLLSRTREALVDSVQGADLAMTLARRFPLALIDEFQDTDSSQWAIFKALYEPGLSGDGCSRANSALLLVGDPKQAIYAFRNADVQTYIEARSAGAHLHRLGDNQRSSRLLIEAVNRLHERSGAFGGRGIQFLPAGVGGRGDDESRQAPVDGQGALGLVLLNSSDEGEVLTPALNDRAARTCAHQIRLLLSGDGAEQPAGKPSDIAVLTRTLAQAGMIKSALADVGVGAVEVSRDSVLLSREGDDLERILSALARPRDDRFVRSALTTELLGFGLSDLQTMSESPAVWEARFDAFGRCQQNWLRQGPEASLRDLLFGYFDRAAALVAMSQGERRMTNILHLFALLNSDDNARQSAAHALSALGRLREQVNANAGRDEATEVRLESDDQLVRILTIHGSKGLEFPFVFLPFLWSAPAPRAGNLVSSRHTDDDGQSRQYIAYRPGLEVFRKPKWGIVPESPLLAESLREQALLDDLEEGLRLNYVALTRASRRCVVYWGYRKETSPAGGLGFLLDSRVALTDKPSIDQIASRIADLAAKQPGITSLAWHDILEIPVPTLVSHAGEGIRPGWPHADALSLQEPVPVAAPPWLTTSFTGLMNTDTSSHGGFSAHAVARPDHDESLSDTLLADTLSASHDIRSRFDRGASAGSCLHDILERVDFRHPVEPELVAQSLRRYGIEQDAAEVAGWLGEVLAASLQIPGESEIFSLTDIAPDDAIAELDYLLPVKQSRASSLAARVGQAYPLHAALDERAIDGFMTGFIDLIVRRDSRYYLLDWKSNWLSADIAAYGLSSMEEAIAAHGYSLQFCLYAVALQRWLRHCLPDYNYEQHFGGVFYVFLRGAGLSGAPAGNGVYAVRPEQSLLDDLDHLLEHTTLAPL